MSNTVKNKYRRVDNVKFDAAWPDLTCLLWLFRFAPVLSGNPMAWTYQEEDADIPWSGTGRLEYCKAIAEMLFPKSFEQHDWSLRALEAFCDNTQSAITGCGGSSKSTSGGLYGWQFYQCDPLHTAVLIVSTTLSAAKKRIWKNVSGYYSEFCRLTGYRESSMVGNPAPSICPIVVDSHGMSKRDTAYGVHVVAVAQGELEKGINSLKGFHPERLLVIVDECDAVSQAVVDVLDNLRIGCEEFQAIFLGNDPSLFNPLGRLMEPEHGKPVGLEHHEWVSTQGVHCLRFDGYDSPNIRDNDKWKGIIRQRDIDAITRNGTQVNTPMSWIMVRGIHPPEGSDDTVLSEAAIVRFNCRDKVDWQRGFISSASLDAGFGGDPCVYRTFRRGLDISGVMRCAIDEVIEIPIDASNKDTPPEYQIAHKAMELSKARGIPPEEFILSSTGIGRGAVAVLQREWSSRIKVYEEGGACSEKIVSDEDPRPANLLYDRKITEIYFSIREFVEAGMIRNLDNATAVQLCNRKHFTKGTGTGLRKSLEKKEDMKARGLKSPNESDALGGYIELLREMGINATVQGPAKKPETEESVREWDFDSSEDCYQMAEL